ncbi:hypothetical protein Tco_0783411 [Tanacetum coccineum]
MSNSNTNLQTQTSNALHNAIMEAGAKDRPPMLAPSNYVQWKSRIKRYIVTKPNNELIHYCLQNPPYKFKWTEKTVPVAEESRAEVLSLSHALWYILKQLKNEVNEIRAEKSNARTANPLALVAITTTCLPSSKHLSIQLNIPPPDRTVYQKQRKCNCDLFCITYLEIQKPATIQEVTPDPVDNSEPIFDDELMHLGYGPGWNSDDLDQDVICYLL